MNRPLSHTSNTVKLYKHLDRLLKLQQGTVSPIMVHMSPTHKCQMNCSFCCFRNRDKALEMPFEVLKEGVCQFHQLGTKAIELTGGGEPTLYPYVNETIEFLHKSLGMHMGINTNALELQRVDHWEYFDWIRISFNTLDYFDSINIDPIRKSGAYVSACYIWHDLSTIETFKKVIDFANKHKIVCRIAPDCIKSAEEIDMSVEIVRGIIKEHEHSDYIFLSDFNIDTYRHNHKCYLHLIKPFFYTDGYVYPCPSMELAYEHDAKPNEDYRTCRYDEILDFYKNNAFDIPQRTCSYCKYAKQQIVLEEVLTETTFNEFA